MNNTIDFNTAKTIDTMSKKIDHIDDTVSGFFSFMHMVIGHLVELAPPSTYDEKYVKWNVADLPILPQRWQYLVSASTKKQFGILKKLMHRADVESIICATDAG